ncbi:hypothetical protein, partial [Streptococcus pseudopneumoniae]|uniref:hypothetical protein n=1 Tax=Streptococcus pseudopneumoniae TaxID=257758 RepID=UPI0019D65810
MVEDLTYTKAGSREPGVLSRTDIEGAAQSLGFNNPDPAVRRVALSRAVSDIHSTTVRTAEAAGTPILPGYES